MSFILALSLFVIFAYLLQMLFGFLQIRHFNRNFVEMRRKGRVAIGRKAGKVKSGTIVMFALDDQDKIIDARVLQGVTVLARFKQKNQYNGEDIHFIDRKHPLVREENLLTIEAMEDARKVFLTVEMGTFKDTPKSSPLGHLAFQGRYYLNNIGKKIRRSA